MKKTLCALGAALLIALALMGLKNEYARLLPGGDYGMQPLIKEKQIEHLFIGSSMFRQGLDIRALEDTLGDSVYILSYNGNQPVLMAEELEYLLSEGVEVKHLYIDLYAYTAAADPWISDTKILLDTDLSFKRETWKLLEESSGPKLKDLFEFYVTANNEQLLIWPVQQKLLASQFYKGGSLNYSAGTTKEALDYTLGERDGVNPYQAEGYRKLIDLCAENAIDLHFIETPKYQSMTEDPTYISLMEECRACVSACDITGPEVTDLDREDPANFQDLIHLSSEGRAYYTAQLGAYLAENIND